jgi:ddrB-like ParB superfamily domain/Transglutaminase-like superfamily
MLTKNQVKQLIVRGNKHEYLQRNPSEINKNVSEIIHSVIPVGIIEVQALAPYIKGKTESETAFNIHKFVRKHVERVPDPLGTEYIRYPYLTLTDGKGDCEDISALIACLLTICGINSKLVVADCEDGYKHIYNVIRTPIYLVVDGCTSVCGAEIRSKKIREFSINMGLGRIGIDPKMARIEGKFSENGHWYYRQNDITDKVIKGKSCKIGFSLDVEVDGYYALIPADLLQPSHLGNIENPEHFLPDAQPRNRAMSESGANTPRLIAERLRPSEICEGSTAYSGCPVINERGEVIQGNGRAYTMKYYWNMNPADTKYYFDYLLENQLSFGFLISNSNDVIKTSNNGDMLMSDYLEKRITNFKEESVNFTKKPVLVRIVPCSDEEAIQLGQLKQSDTEAVSTYTGGIKSKINRIDDKLRDSLINNLFPEGGNPDLSLTQQIHASDLPSLLMKKGIYRSDEFVEKYLHRNSGLLNPEGIKEMTNLVLGLVFKNADTNTLELFKDLPDRVQTALIKSAKYILDSKPENSIMNETGKAIFGINNYFQFKVTGGGFTAWQTQGNMFGKSPIDEYSRTELGIIKLCGESRTQVEIVDAFKKYHFLTRDESNGMFGVTRKAYNKNIAVEMAFWYEYEVLKSQLLKLKL